MRSIFFWRMLLAGGLVLVSACVPSPTATPSRQTPFPTLPLVDETATPEGGTNALDETPEATSDAAQADVTNVPPTPALNATQAALKNDLLAPIVQLTAQNPTAPISAGLNVPLNVYAADNSAITRLELYDNNVLAGQAAVIVPSAVYLNQFTWQANVLGKHILRAVAYDAGGNASAPAQLELNVITNNRAPEVQITDPSGHKDAEIGAPLVIQGVATDDVAVTRMELLVDNQVVTFVTPDKQGGGVTPFAVAIPWTPTATGSHNIILRAYDNQNQSDDSLRYTVTVFDNQAPVVNAQGEYTMLAPGDVLVVDTLALSNNGIARLELYVDGVLRDTVNSSAPARQTALKTSLTAPDLGAGSHSFFVRAFDVTGQTTDTPGAAIQIQQGAPRVPHETRAAEGANTPLPPTPTATPKLVLPGPPTIELELTNAPVVLPNAAKIQITARGSSELDRVELWVRAPGETGAQLALEENVQGATEKTLVYDWNAPRAGVVEMYARVHDNLKQERVSEVLRFGVQPPLAPTTAAAGYDFAQIWRAESPAARFDVTFAPIGRALRGAFVESRADGNVLNGKIVSGAVNDKSVLFAVDFGPETNHTFEFDCSFNARPPVLTCNYANENGERGSAVFEPVKP